MTWAAERDRRCLRLRVRWDAVRAWWQSIRRAELSNQNLGALVESLGTHVGEGCPTVDALVEARLTYTPNGYTTQWPADINVGDTTDRKSVV